MAKDERMIAALLRERDGYQRRGLDDRVRQVDEQLKHYGYTGDPDENDGPQGRIGETKRTAEAGKPAAKKTAAKKTAASKPPAAEPTIEQPAPPPTE
ncbi:hypothetical protein PV355_40595 [Streptomyces stelliscabiei]|uniref:hypothetical protein n=1 Tax=Streptomyces stelliscabiei TaxID=146820 RepID=UPI0029B78333|nr:hypothetical protein [Streptomyces stelliscabiei]MDX2521373.1 hypothetical protein [Streptomyces stelliscabiei]